MAPMTTSSTMDPPNNRTSNNYPLEMVLPLMEPPNMVPLYIVPLNMVPLLVSGSFESGSMLSGIGNIWW